MPTLLWLAIALVVLWLVVKFVFKAVSGMVHILLLLAVIVIVMAYMR